MREREHVSDVHNSSARRNAAQLSRCHSCVPSDRDGESLIHIRSRHMCKPSHRCARRARAYTHPRAETKVYYMNTRAPAPPDTRDCATTSAFTSAFKSWHSARPKCTHALREHVSIPYATTLVEPSYCGHAHTRMHSSPHGGCRSKSCCGCDSTAHVYLAHSVG
jgi:hypothetical protein